MSNRIPQMSVLALAAAFALGASTPGVAAELPRHKAGIWETTMIVNGAEPMVMKL